MFLIAKEPLCDFVTSNKWSNGCDTYPLSCNYVLICDRRPWTRSDISINLNFTTALNGYREYLKTASADTKKKYTTSKEKS